MNRIELNGQPIGFAKLADIGAGRSSVSASAEGMARVRAGRAVLEEAVAAGRPVYGTTTGVGAMKDVEWSPDAVNAFNLGLVRAHHFGTGPAFPTSVVRNAMAIRVNTALTGHVGCSQALVEAFLALLDRDVIPVVRKTGSIGCGDIGLMGQIGAVLVGDGEALFKGRRMSSADALAAAGLKPLTMAPRDGLAALGVNAVSFANGAETIRQATGSIRVLLATGLMACGALGASRDPWEAVTAVGTPREAQTGAWLLQAAEPWNWGVTTHIQDPLSVRMIAQVFGSVFESLMAAGFRVVSATSRPDDNPVVADGRILTSGGSLPLDVTLLFESAALAMAHAARNAFNRCVLMGNGMRPGLPVNLVPPGAIATGFGPMIKLAGEIFSRVLSMVNPVSAQSLVVAGGLEDEAAFLPLVIDRFDRQMEALKRLAAIEAMLAAQALDIMNLKPEGLAGEIYRLVRKHSAFLTVDRALSCEIEAIELELASDGFLRRLTEIVPLPSVDDFFALAHQPRSTVS